MNSLEKLSTFGQSPWLDDLRRSLVTEGGLQSLIDNGLRGLTSNPAIFEAAIAQSNDYDDAIQQLAQDGKSVEEIYRTLTVEDVQGACDLFRRCTTRQAELTASSLTRSRRNSPTTRTVPFRRRGNCGKSSTART